MIVFCLSTTDGQNSIIGDLLSEVEIGKQTPNLIDKIFKKKAPSVKDIDTRSNLKKLKLFNRSLPGRKNDDDNDYNDDYDDVDENNNNKIVLLKNKKNDNNEKFELEDLPNLPNVLQQDLSDTIKNEDPVIKNIDNILDGPTQKN